jgi:quercetin dioxygenase-like cupin family protein
MLGCKPAPATEDGGVTTPDLLTAPGEVQLRCDHLSPALAFFVGELGFRIETIFPADDPQVASLSGHGLRLRLAPGEGDAGTLRLAGAPRVLTAPNGTRVEFVDPDPPIEIPRLKPQFMITRQAGGPVAGEGRAGMLYRDLIPGRLGGRFIASHISIPTGGPVADWVHFHKIRFQMIFCRTGWARLVYEDQGPPFLFNAGDLVIQPPRIRHRVLESSDAFEVVEIGCPARHETLADHAMTLPTATLDLDRDYGGGQRFLHHKAAETPWTAHGTTGFERRETGTAAATAGLADVRVIRPAGARGFTAPPHDGEFFFGFLLAGSAQLDHGEGHPLGPADAFVIPAGEAWGLSEASDDLELLEVILPAGASATTSAPASA